MCTSLFPALVVTTLIEFHHFPLIASSANIKIRGLRANNLEFAGLPCDEGSCIAAVLTGQGRLELREETVVEPSSPGQTTLLMGKIEMFGTSIKSDGVTSVRNI